MFFKPLLLLDLMILKTNLKKIQHEIIKSNPKIKAPDDNIYKNLIFRGSSIKIQNFIFLSLFNCCKKKLNFCYEKDTFVCAQ
jgi:hypothetical protein